MSKIPMKSVGAYSSNNLQGINQLRIGKIMTAQNIATLNRITTNGTASPAYSQNSANQHGHVQAPHTTNQTTRMQPQNSTPHSGYIPPQNTGSQPVYGQPNTLNRQPAQYQPQQSGYIPPQNTTPQPTTAHVPAMPIPPLTTPIQKGQKATLMLGQPPRIEALLGWNVTNQQCDVDVSAFLLGENGKVLGDDWFVFYGQTNSPDNSTRFSADAPKDREKITIDLQALNPSVTKIVFVLTINDAVEKRLNFSMLKDAYIRLMNPSTGQEMVSFKMTDYYSNVISMMIGEVYLYKGQWKFNAIGNGVDRDLAGLCELYGVEVI